MNSCEHSPDGYHDAGACPHCLRAALAEIERLRAARDTYRLDSETRAKKIERLRAEVELLTGNKWSEIELALAEYRAKRLHERLFGSDECRARGEGD